ncbi:hypothetical protein SAMD00019534_036040 [Acytostelium subglobosum LB1]|uniref:hypothetical protein n=1 Tax=Acytostelium subglobosum LB1 TaxID=1410327 RepID=UPI0006451462|nr:hypothetical protein SAMD00019534_036040 [Acytostelium subglobosum LB1]GAM20429.1 hypothetical protein SAMD00019534_036040 [Acytostelium subglobosum LB1]|eukprot:XP_012759950.1 hypothetical protein SAMD00019534_036040 [Acytostelium subglobosum LB1]
MLKLFILALLCVGTIVSAQTSGCLVGNSCLLDTTYTVSGQTRWNCNVINLGTPVNHIKLVLQDNAGILSVDGLKLAADGIVFDFFPDRSMNALQTNGNHPWSYITRGDQPATVYVECGASSTGPVTGTITTGPVTGQVTTTTGPAPGCLVGNSCILDTTYVVAGQTRWSCNVINLGTPVNHVKLVLQNNAGVISVDGLKLAADGIVFDFFPDRSMNALQTNGNHPWSYITYGDQPATVYVECGASTTTTGPITTGPITTTGTLCPLSIQCQIDANFHTVGQTKYNCMVLNNGAAAISMANILLSNNANLVSIDGLTTSNGINFDFFPSRAQSALQPSHGHPFTYVVNGVSPLMFNACGGSATSTTTTGTTTTGTTTTGGVCQFSLSCAADSDFSVAGQTRFNCMILNLGSPAARINVNLFNNANLLALNGLTTTDGANFDFFPSRATSALQTNHAHPFNYIVSGNQQIGINLCAPATTTTTTTTGTSTSGSSTTGTSGPISTGPVTSGCTLANVCYQDSQTTENNQLYTKFTCEITNLGNFAISHTNVNFDDNSNLVKIDGLTTIDAGLSFDFLPHVEQTPIEIGAKYSWSYVVKGSSPLRVNICTGSSSTSTTGTSTTGTTTTGTSTTGTTATGTSGSTTGSSTTTGSSSSTTGQCMCPCACTTTTGSTTSSPIVCDATFSQSLSNTFSQDGCTYSQFNVTIRNIGTQALKSAIVYTAAEPLDNFSGARKVEAHNYDISEEAAAKTVMVGNTYTWSYVIKGSAPTAINIVSVACN